MTQPDTTPNPDRLRTLPPEQLAADTEAARIVARLLRRDTTVKPVKVAAFASYI